LTGGGLALRSAAGRWTLAAAVLGSGAVFLESTVASVALPAMGRQFDLGFEGLQWVMNAYLLPLSALILLGGSLGDRYSRPRMFALGLLGFGAASALCALAMGTSWLMAARVAQGSFGALVVPNSLALLEELFSDEDRGAAIGQWAGWSAASTALGPALGGWLVGEISWRWVFAIVVPVAAAAAIIALRRVPDAASLRPVGRTQAVRVDYFGAALAAVGLGGITGALVFAPRAGLTPLVVVAGVGGLLAAAGFLLFERRARHPLLPLKMFESRQFSGTNLVTLLVYAALGVFFFLYFLMLQNVLGYEPFRAGVSLLPLNGVMLALSMWTGRLSTTIGARVPMTVGSLIAAGGFVLLARVGPGSSYVTGILPGLLVFGLGLAILVAPLTSAVLGAVPDGDAGMASAVNNAAARLAGLIGTAVVPLAAGLGGVGKAAGPAFSTGYMRAMMLSAALCAAGGAVAWLTVRRQAAAGTAVHPHPSHGCVRLRAQESPSSSG
jgi:EmrB/QacA subfamily drug resistance transporter